MLEKIPLLALSAVGSTLTFAAQRSAGAISGLQFISPTSRLANAACVYLEYIGQSIWPAKLAVLYPWSGRTMGEAVPAGIILLAITAAVLRFRQTAPLSPDRLVLVHRYAGPRDWLVQVGAQSRADRYMYIPLVGLSIAVIWAARRVETKSRLQRLLAAARVCSFYYMARLHMLRPVIGATAKHSSSTHSP